MHAIKTLYFCVILFCTVSISPHVNAKTTQFQDWYYVDSQAKAGEKCTIYSFASRTKGTVDDSKRDDAYFYVIKKGPRQYTIGVTPGFEIADDSYVVMKIGRRSYDFNNANPDYAWTYSSAQDIYLIDELIKASGYFTMHLEDIDGKVALDYYSLNGFIKSMRALDKCAN